MNILIFTNRDLASNYHLNLVMPHLAGQVKAVFVTDKVGKKDQALPPYPLQEIKFFEQGLPNQLLFPQLDNQNRENTDKLLTFKELSKKYNFDFHSCNEVKSDATLDLIKSYAPDLIFSIRFGKIFNEKVLNIPTFGVLNLHSGLLPNYRGVLAVFRALMNGDDEIKATLHFIDDNQIDTGRIIGFSTLKVDKSKSLLWHILNLYPKSIELSVKTINAIANGEKIATFAQNNEKAAYFTFPTETELEVFLQKGFKMVDVKEMESFYGLYM